MPWCPSCRQEYRATVTSCGDCGKPLVADLAAHDAAERAAQATKVLRVIAPGGTLAALLPWLEQRKIPFRRDEAAGALLVPEAAGEQIEAGLAQVAEYERVGDVLHVYGPRQDLEPKLEADASWLKKSLEELAQEPSATVTGLIGLLASPVQRYRVAAAERLAALEAQKTLERANVVIWAAQSRMRKALFGWSALLAADPPAGLAARLVTAAATAPSDVVTLLLHVVGELKDASVAAQLLPLLDHEDPMVRDDADEVLMSLAGIDIGFEADADPATRARTIQLWRDWIEQHARP